jgi:hypothetical protein
MDSLGDPSLHLDPALTDDSGGENFIHATTQSGRFDDGIPITPAAPEAPQHWSSWFTKFFSWNTKKSSISPVVIPPPQVAQPWFSWRLNFGGTKISTAIKNRFSFFSWNREATSSAQTEPPASIMPSFSQTSSPALEIIAPTSLTQKTETESLPPNFVVFSKTQEEDLEKSDQSPLDPQLSLPSSLREIDPWEDLTESEKDSLLQQLTTRKPISILGPTERDQDNVRSLPKCTVYQFIELPPLAAAALFWDQETLGKATPGRIKTSVSKIDTNAIEVLAETSIGIFGMPNDQTKIILQVEQTTDHGYFFSWTMSPGDQPKSYAKANKGSLLFISYEEKTLLRYQATTTLQNNFLYKTAANQIKQKTETAIQRIVSVLQQGFQDSKKLECQIAVLERA